MFFKKTMSFLRLNIFRSIDWVLFVAILPLLVVGLLAMNSFTESNYFFDRQLLWITLSLATFFILSLIDWSFLRRSWIIASIYIFGLFVLFLLPIFGLTTRGVQSWFTFGGVSLQPVDFMKIVLVLILAKYFSRRHIEIANFRHIFISGLYAFIPFLAVLFQPDFGSAIIIFLIWLGMALVSGISKKHLALVFGVAVFSFLLAWMFIFAPYQKDRIVAFIHPLADIQGTGYNALQSTIAVGSGELFGKGVGYGTQSRLKFLPEFQTDFIFAAFAEEWGFIGVLILFFIFSVVLWRILKNASLGETNFEILFGLGLAIVFISHFIIHVGMNIGLLPVTGLTLPFVSYGGSHLLASFIGLGILMGMRKHALSFHKDDMDKEFLGGL